MAGLLENRSCWECYFHDWDTDKCALGRRAGVITGDEPACQSHQTHDEFTEDLTQRLELRRAEKEGIRK